MSHHATTSHLADQTPLPNTPTSSPDFADNMAIYWFDHQGTSGVIGLGHWPNQSAALDYVAWGDAVSGIGYQRTRAGLPLREDDRQSERMRAGSVLIERLGAGHHLVRAEIDSELAIELELFDAYPLTPFPDPDKMDLLQTVAPDHVETSGRVIGSVRHGERTRTIEGAFHRDRSWGDRRPEVPVTSYHWSVGTTGTDLSWAEIVCTIAGVGTFRNAYVHLDGRVHACRTASSLMLVDEDDLTVRGWRTVLLTTTGRTVRVDVEHPVVHLLDRRSVPEMTATDTFGVCTVTVDGVSQQAFAALNRITNPRLGRNTPVRYLGGSVEEGWFEFAPIGAST